MDYKVVEKKRFHVIGVRQVTPEPGGIWKVIKEDGRFEKLDETFFGGNTPIGLCWGIAEDGSNDNMGGIQFDGTPINAFDMWTFPAGKWLSFQAKGKISDQVLGKAWQEIHENVLPNCAHEQNMEQPTAEFYHVWDEAGDACDVEILIPIVESA